MSLENLSPLYIGGDCYNGHLRLYLDDDTDQLTPIYLYENLTYVDNHDGTATITPGI
jgi:hypothetical protein